MKGEKLSLLQRCIKWREDEYKGKAIYSHIKFPGWYFHSVCCINIEILYPSDTEFPDR